MFFLINILTVIIIVVGCSGKKKNRNIPSVDVEEVAGDDKAAKLTSNDCIDPNLSSLALGEKLMLCDGSIGKGTYVAPEAKLPNCNTDGGTDCSANSSYPAADYSNLVATNIKIGVQIGGITGTKRDQIICKNGKGIAAENGDVTTPWDGVVVGTTNMTTNGTTAVTGSGFSSYLSVGDIITVNGESRRITVITNATNLTVDSAFTSSGSYGFTYYSPNADDDVDDYQNNQDPRYTGAGVSTCNEDTMSDVTGADPLLPNDGQVPNGGNYQDWTKIYQDELTGLYFTNILNTAFTWTLAVNLCKGLDGSTAGDGWRLPTKKELLQLFINGLGEFNNGEYSGTTNWVSTSYSLNARAAWHVYFQYDYLEVYYNLKGFNTFGAFCVRE